MFTTFNSITISGVINRDLEYQENKQDPSKTVLHYNVVCYLPYIYQNEKGQKKQERLFFGCNSYGKEAIRLASLLKKGSYVMVSGNVRPNFYTTKNGMNVFALNIDVTSCLPIEIARNQNNPQQNPQNQQNNRQNTNSDRSVEKSNENQRSQNTEMNTSVPPQRRASMPGTNSTRSSQSVDQNCQNSQANDQGTRNQNQAFTQENYSAANGNNSGNRSEQHPRNNGSANEFSNLKPEENPFNMSAQNMTNSMNEPNPYGDGTLPMPDGYIKNGNY